MNILVCVSRVPDTATKIMIADDGKSINTQGVKYIINPYDEFALEEAIRLKEKNGGTVTAVTVGPEKSQDVLRTALAMGVDKAIIVKADEGFDSYFAAENLNAVVSEVNPDIIFLGRQSVDYDSWQMASMLGEMAGMPSISVVSKLDIEGNKVTAERDIEGGKEIVETTLPCLISTQKGLNEPRYPKLPDIMKAKSKPIDVKDPAGSGSRTTVLSMEIPSKQRSGKILGDSESDINELVRLLHEESKVI
ncbi:MAG: electron transfer flavoprotein subunit beta/FixA family protein [Bacteroidota bacterium]